MAGLRFDPAQLLKGLDAAQQRTLYAVETAGRVGAAEMERYAKREAPWTNRTGLARSTIQGKVERSEYGVRITLAGGVYYMVYLELARKKRWAILWPTVQQKGPEILRQIARLK